MAGLSIILEVRNGVMMLMFRDGLFITRVPKAWNLSTGLRENVVRKG